jgi:hypothetical protein
MPFRRLGNDANEIVRRYCPDPYVFRGCATTEDKLAALADRYADAVAWRFEESEIVKHLETRVDLLTRRIAKLEGTHRE